MDITRLDSTTLLVKLNANPSGADVQSWTERFKEEMQPEDRLAWVDLTALEVVSSLGVNAVVGCYKALEKQGGTVRVAVPNEKIRQVFELFQLHTLFSVDIVDAETWEPPKS